MIEFCCLLPMSIDSRGRNPVLHLNYLCWERRLVPSMVYITLVLFHVSFSYKVVSQIWCVSSCPVCACCCRSTLYLLEFQGFPLSRWQSWVFVVTTWIIIWIRCNLIGLSKNTTAELPGWDNNMVFIIHVLGVWAAVRCVHVVGGSVWKWFPSVGVSGLPIILDICGNHLNHYLITTYISIAFF